jgi:hypothetical protein
MRTDRCVVVRNVSQFVAPNAVRHQARGANLRVCDNPDLNRTIGRLAGMHKTILLCLFIMLLGCGVVATRADVPSSDIKNDEFVVFFRTSAWLDEERQEWHVPIHGWIYEPEDSTARTAQFSGILKSQYDLEPDATTNANYTRRLNLMIADNERDTGADSENLYP